MSGSILHSVFQMRHEDIGRYDTKLRIFSTVLSKTIYRNIFSLWIYLTTFSFSYSGVEGVCVGGGASDSEFCL